MTKLGILLLIFGILFTVFAGIFLATSDSAIPFLESTLCADNETLVKTSNTNMEGEQTINFLCQKNDGGERRDATGSFILIIFLTMIPIVFAIVLIIIGSRRKTNESYLSNNVAMQQQLIEQLGQTGRTQFTVSSGDPRNIDNVISAVMSNMDNITNAQQLTLKQKLEQLREAYDAGLITYEEFEVRKDRVLDEIAED